ncbi:cold shock domain-containing protein [Streptomyces sp. NBC_01321]|uniref:cold shock domain-containing protein n=1 Tax=Streptomyces sp. NBC_01321 TaxID=2903825 RepID=UPI002E160E5D
MVQLRKGLRLHCAGRRRADVFAYYSNISGSGYRELTEGEQVTFDIGQGQKGPQAENIIRG